ncbi:Uncharacterized protein Fot_15702 [Forsythia ovata]|uniref:Uncharacterized protein n=1 Tax=Forsythia ovata TaxID=205694 RepID=A0ABD1W9Z6_9LAMI
MVVSVRADLQRERAAHSECSNPHSASASHRRRLRANGGILCARKAHREEKRERERAAHSEEPTPNRDCESPAAAARRKWWEVQREEGPPRGDPQLDWGVHSEEEAAPQRFCVQRRCVYGVQRRWIWRSPAVAVGWGISRARRWGKIVWERRETEMGRGGWGGVNCFGQIVHVEF